MIGESLAQLFAIQYHLVYLIPRAGVVHLVHARQAVRLELGGDTSTEVEHVPGVALVGDGLEVATYIDVVVGVYIHRIGQRVTLYLVLHTALSDGVSEALYALILDIEDEVVGDVHIQLGIDHRYIALGIPIVQLPEHRTVHTILVLYHGALLNLRDGELYLVVVVVDLGLGDGALLHRGLDHLAAIEIESCGLDVLYRPLETSHTVRHRSVLLLERRAAADAVHWDGHER